jgi:hypothetical protein
MNIKTTAFCLALLTGAWLTQTGCDRPGPYDREVATSRTNATVAEVKKEVKEAVDASKSYAARGKDDFVAAMDQKLTELDAKIAELSAKAGTLKEDAKDESAKALDALRAERAQLGRKFKDLKGSSQEAWQDVKAGFESAYVEVEKAYQDVKAKFSR